MMNEAISVQHIMNMPLRKIALVLMAITFALITGMQDILHIRMFFYLRLILIAFMFLVLDTSSMCRFYLFALMLSSDVVLYWTNICFGILYTLKCYRSLRFTTTIKVAVLLVLFEFLHSLLFFSSGNIFIHILKQAGFSLVLLVTLFYIQRCDPVLDFRSMFSYWLFGLLSACTIFYTKYILRFGLAYALSFSAGIGLNSELDSIYTYNMHPNMLSRLCGITLSIIVIMLLMHRHTQIPIARLPYICIAGLLCFFGFLTGSMSFYLMLSIIAVFTIIAVLKDFKTMRAVKTFLFILCIVLIGIVVMQLWFPNALLRAFRDLGSQDISTGRFTIWLKCLYVFMKAPWICITGIGLQDYHDVMISMFQMDTDLLHNVVLEVILAWGIIGVFLISSILYGIYKEKIHSTLMCTQWIGIVPLAVMAVVFLTGNFFYGYYMNFSFLMITIIFAAYVNTSMQLQRKEGCV